MAFERIKAFFRKGGFATDTLQSPIDHPRIGVDADEYARIQRNLRLYACKYGPVEYFDSAGILKKREFVPLNIVKVAANWMATIIFNDKCRINVADDAAGAYITELFRKNNFNQNFQQYLEAMYATSGLVIRPYYAAAANTIKLSWVTPDRFFPLASNTGEISEGAFITKTREVIGDKVCYYSLFEFHEWENTYYIIRYELYKSHTPDAVGKRVPLGTLGKYAEFSEKITMSGLSRPLFVYLKPATMNNLSIDSPLGLGICDNALPTIDTINVLHDKFRRNIDRSRSAVAIDPEHIEIRQENGTIWQVRDPDDIFLAIPGRMDNEPFKEISIPIQPDQYITSINFELRTFEAQTGFSPGTFVFEPKGLRTATEVVSEDSMTYQTRNKQIVVLEAGIRELVHSILELAYAAGLYTGELHPAVTVDFDDGVFQDKGSQLDYYSKAVAQKMMPRLEGIKRAFNLTEGDAKKWFAAINQEEADKLAEASRLHAALAFGAPTAEE